MTARIYSNTAFATSLVSGITAAATSLVVSDATGYPAAPFALVIDPGSVTSEEIMLVTAKSGATFTVTRGYDGTTAKVHAAGALVIHAAIADDFRGMQLGTRDVSSAAPSDNQGLVWDNANSIWEPGTPSPGGGAGGVLSGTYPNPGFAVNMAEQSELDAHTSLTTTAHGNIVPQSRTLTINGVALDLSADRSWTVTGGVSGVTATSPLQSSGGATPDISFINQSANVVLAGPASGGAAAPAFRALVKADLLAAVAYEDEANVFTATQAIAIDDAATNTTTTLATLRHTSSGTPAASFGSRVLWQLESATVADRDAAAIDVFWTTATDASRTAAFGFRTVSSAGALTERMRLTGAGALMLGNTLSSPANSLLYIEKGSITATTEVLQAQALTSAAVGDVTGFSFYGYSRNTTGTSTRFHAAFLQLIHDRAGSLTNGGALFVRLQVIDGTVTNLRGVYSDVYSVTSTGAVTNAKFVEVPSPTISGSGAITNLDGIYINNQNVATTLNHALRTNAGNVVFNEGGDANSDVRIEGDTDQNLLFSDASADKMGIGTNAPNEKLEVVGTIRADGLRLDLTPTAETPAMTHTFTISLNGTNYKVPVVAA